MAGGTWNLTDMPVLPGFYMAFRAAAAAAIQPGERGVVIVPVKAHWGPVRQFVELTREADIADAYSLDETGGASAVQTVRLALLGGARKVLAYRLTDGTEAKAAKTLQDTAATPANVLKLEAKQSGARGNAFKVTIQANPVDAAKKDIKLYEGTTLLRTFTFAGSTIQAAVDAVNGDAANKWIVASKLADGNGTLANLSGSALSGGASGIEGIAASDYVNAMSAFETQSFNVVTLDGVTDPALLTSLASWVARIRTEGNGVIAVLGGSAAEDKAADAVAKASARSAGFNLEGIVNVGTGALLDGAEYSSAQLSAYVAGLIAGQALSASTTYAPTPFDDVTRRWTRSEQEQAVRGGVFLFVHDGRLVKALRGVTSLVTLSGTQNAAWKKIRTIRVLDSINADLQRTAEDQYIGKVNNTEEGRLALVGACKQYMNTLAQAGVIEATGYDVAVDDAIVAAPDQVFLKWEARLTDVVEQIFGTFIVR
ncbi:phage tail sheath subtilisin-like domain-containing protein [Cohnella nanjingensis]|uniref:Phage tail sheath family protein n=1 Tax=Cohnella nanjingensis TaxID=1387779 RepID=A0A7X0VIG4_9BACL|nr:phage tail sheath subtilisin-like domain-containing protein [Cohnella nanjingensis]MBB6674513.1 phage tail sheath family protein [Cohnella nanjingensis]